MEPQQALPPPPTLKRNTKAFWSLVFGIIGFWPLSLIGSVVALVLGYRAKAEIDRSGGTQSGRGLALAGIILGWIPLASIAVFVTWASLACGAQGCA